MILSIQRYYKFVEGKSPKIAYIMIKKGQYKGIVFNFEKIEFREQDDECKLYFEYTIQDNPKGYDENDKKLKKLIYKILKHCIEKEVELSEKV